MEVTMPNYLLAFHGGSTPETADEQVKVMQAWNDWIEANDDAMVDIGNPVVGNVTLRPDGTTGGMPGDPVTGYTIIEAEDLDEALVIARECPILASNGTVEIGELMEVSGEEDEEDEDDDDDDDD
jgi:hypothetical protein